MITKEVLKNEKFFPTFCLYHPSIIIYKLKKSTKLKTKSMKKAINSLLFTAILGFATITFTSCKKEGCTDVNANNYNDEAKKDDGTCTYPVINTAATGKSGDVSGEGGTASKTFTFTNSNTTVGWDMSMGASTGSFQLTIKDAAGVVVVDKTLTAGSGPQDAAGTSAAGTAGTWTAIINLTKFTGRGDYSFQ